MRAKKAVAVAAAALMAASAVGALAGCGGDPEHTIEILLLANNNETAFYREYFKAMEETLLEETGVKYKINFRGQQEGPYKDQLGSAVQRDSLPDIFYLRPNEILQYKDKIANLQSYADGAGAEYADLSDVHETALNMYRFNPQTGTLGNPEDDLYAFPKDLSSQQLGYNRKQVEKYQTYIKEAGLKLPWEMDWETETYTWNEYLTMCKTIADHAESGTYAACDVPSIEILAHSFGGELIDLSEGRTNGKINSLTEGAVQQAIEYQARLIDCGAADYKRATYSNFSAGRVCFYGLVGSWEIGEYNNNPSLGKGNWEVMPWPTVDGGTEWAGTITSAGYVVSKKCASMAKGDIAKRIAISFMSSYTQNKLVRDSQISLPLLKSWEEDYKSSENDSVYSPASRGVYLDVISGKHGFFPAEYSTYDSVWIDQFNTPLEVMWNEGKGKALAKYNSTDWAATQSTMQQYYDRTKNN